MPNKKVCDSCEKFINNGQCITECAKCLNIIHSRCFSKSSFKKINDKYYYKACHLFILQCYNPFKVLLKEANNESDLSLNDFPFSFSEDLTKASDVLDQCANFESKDVSIFLNEKTNSFNTYFLNIDGNKTNFNVFYCRNCKIKGGSVSYWYH